MTAGHQQLSKLHVVASLRESSIAVCFKWDSVSEPLYVTTFPLMDDDTVM